MNIKAIRWTNLILLLVTIIAPIQAYDKNEVSNADFSGREGLHVKINTYQEQIPVLVNKSDNQLLLLYLKVNSNKKYYIKKIKINLDGTTELNDIESVKLCYIGNDALSMDNRQFGKVSPAKQTIVFRDNFIISDQNAYFKVLIKLKEGIDLTHKVNGTCESIETDVGLFIYQQKTSHAGLRLGVALRQHRDDNVDTYRIPGLITTSKGTLLAIYDVRRESSRDLQGNIDIGLSRSVNGGNTWEPMQIVLDMGTWGGLPEKFNGVSDACILVDEKTNNVFIAGLWMYGVINPDGEWIEGVNESSTEWNHQWKNKGSQPGFDVKETSQFIITKSADDGQTWSGPVNLTKMCKKEGWWLWAPAPGHGITLSDGTLVFPTQGRDRNGNAFSNITWSKDGGENWITSGMASQGTNENMVVQLADGSIMLNARDSRNRGNTSDNNGRVISVTADLGETWSSHPTSRGALIEPGCMASLHKHEYTQNGQRKSILLFSNPHSKTDRDHITIKVSFDDGHTWPEEYWVLLDEKKGRGYSCLASIDEQTIGILYEGSQADMIFQKIDLDELIDE